MSLPMRNEDDDTVSDRSGRIQELVRKMAIWKGQSTSVGNFLALQRLKPLDQASINARMSKYERVFADFEKLMDELDELDPEGTFHNVVDRYNVESTYYNVLTEAEKILNGQPEPIDRAANNVSPSLSANASSNGLKRRIKLPESKLPTFDGDHTLWLSFKTEFDSMIGNQSDLCETDKLHYLRSALKGDALRKVQMLSITEENYRKTWEVLESAYSDKRIIASRHLYSLIHLPKQEREDAQGISRTVDLTRQHLESLKSMNATLEDMIVALIEDKMHRATADAWDDKQVRGEFPKLEVLLEFMSRRATRLINREKEKPSLVSGNGNQKYKGKPQRQISHALLTATAPACRYCKEAPHPLYRCKKFLQLNVANRRKVAQEIQACTKCLQTGHKVGNCNFLGCKTCGEPHNNLLHPSPVNEETRVEQAEQVTTTAIVNALDNRGRLHSCRAILDTASTANFISEKLVATLHINRRPCSVPIGGLNDMVTRTRHTVTVKIQATTGGYNSTLDFLVIPKITGLTPSDVVARDAIKIPANLRLADPNFYRPAPIEMLLGAGPTLAVLSIGKYNLTPPGGPDLFAQKTQLGWVIGGTVQAPKKLQPQQNCLSATANFDLERFWAVEEEPKIKHRSDEERRAVEHFKSTHSRDSSGRLIVALPFKETVKQIGCSKDRALRRLRTLERKFARDQEFEQMYRNALEEHLNKGYMTQVEDRIEDGFYLPHHAVIKQDSQKTKVRVVFDGSAKSESGISLNDTLMVGPTIQDDIFCLILRFRLPQYVLTADIEKMFLQFLVRKEDRKFQKILWRNSDGKVGVYELNTVTFGLASSPYQAVQCLQQLADEESHHSPLGATILKSDMYVDDLLTGFPTVEEGVTARRQISKILEAGKLKIRQWASNDTRLLEGLPEDSINQKMHFAGDSMLKTLGVMWNAQTDAIEYTSRAIPRNRKVTKRLMLSEIAKIFDPLGLLGPVVLWAKLMIQKLWQLKITWDESVPSDLYTAWIEFCDQITAIDKIVFDRKILLEKPEAIQLHGFCDASMRGYGACIYLRSTNERGEILCQLICAKSRVAPLKTISLPRLELCSAVLLAKLYETVRSNIPDPSVETYLWSDSMVALHWVHTSPHTLKTFVTNRVAEIQEKTRDSQWRHVPGEHNPADALSRGQLPREFIQNKTWRRGPKWLSGTYDKWPNKQIVKPDEDPEAKRATCLSTEILDTSLLTRFSSFAKLRRIVAYCLRWKNNDHKTKNLSVSELSRAEKTIVRVVQQSEFPQELRELSIGKTLNKRSKLLPLNPFVDKDGLLRVGGRLKNSTLPFFQRHPIVLPKDHTITHLIIEMEHKTQAHAGTQSTLYCLRRRYWILDGRNTVRRIVRKCVTCLGVKPPSINYIMGDLPRARVTMSRPFLNVGVDYCGPFYVKEKKFRNRGKVKTYVAVFICLVSKAVHLELVSDMTSAGFIAALIRFIGRRGKCLQIWSDNGTNFVGADNELKEIVASLRLDEEKVSQHLTEQGIKWQFIPPASPHFGGIWEAAVKSFKHHLKRVVRNELFTFEELNTLIIEIEAILNSRPLTPVSSDPNDLLVLTPGHFLIGDSITSLPERDFADTPTNRLSNWQHIQKVRQHFWARWYKEYLNELTVRSKWQSGQPNLEVGAVVLLKEDNLPPMHWKMGRVLEAIPGADGIVRVVTVKTPSGVHKRNVRKVAPLPVTDNEVSQANH